MGDRKLKRICLVITWHKALRVSVPSVPQWQEEWDVELDPEPGEQSSALKSLNMTPCYPAMTGDRKDSLLLGSQTESDYPPSL